MKKSKVLIIAILVLSLVLSACATTTPNVPSTNEDLEDITSDEYPVEVVHEPDQSEPEDPGQIYPAEPSEVLDGEDDLKGVEAYIIDPQVSKDDLDDHAEDINEFAIELYRKLAARDGNLIFSPYSIFQAFLMTYAGANAETKAEIAEALEIDLEDGDKVHEWMNALNIHLTTRPEYASKDAQPLEFSVANALWAQKEQHYEQAFLDKLAANYNAGLKLVDFSQPEEARQLINLWVEAQTNEKIKELIPAGMLNELTRLVITNAVYFKGAWSHQFDPQLNSLETFYKLDGSQTTVEMMNLRFTGAGLVDDDYQVVRLPYEQSGFSMVVIMPNGDFREFENDLEDELDDIFEDLDESSASIQLGLPKFKIESSFGLADQLKALGMRSAFDAFSADFSGITGAKDLFISDAIHQAYIDVNEQGTEAAAATAIAMEMTSMPGDTIEIKFDRPFIYLIYDQTTEIIVFMGRVLAP